MEPTFEAKWAEYQEAMHRGAWRVGWGFFAVTVGLLPLMWLLIWLVGARAWEQTRFHAPVLMWVGVPLNLLVVSGLVLRLHRGNLALEALKGRYLAELRALRGPGAEPAPPPPPSDPDAFLNE